MTLAIKKQKKGDREFKASLDHIASQYLKKKNKHAT